MIALVMEAVCSRRTWVFIPVPRSYGPQIQQPEQLGWPSALRLDTGARSRPTLLQWQLRKLLSHVLLAPKPEPLSSGASQPSGCKVCIRDIVFRYKWSFLNTNEPSLKGPEKKQSVLILEEKLGWTGSRALLPLYLYKGINCKGSL